MIVETIILRRKFNPGMIQMRWRITIKLSVRWVRFR